MCAARDSPDQRLVTAQVDWDASSAMAELYEGLPVVRVREWTAVTPAFLRSELERLRGSALDMKKLYLPHVRRADISPTNRGDAVDATRTFRGDDAAAATADIPRHLSGTGSRG